MLEIIDKPHNASFKSINTYSVIFLVVCDSESINHIGLTETHLNQVPKSLKIEIEIILSPITVTYTNLPKIQTKGQSQADFGSLE